MSDTDTPYPITITRDDLVGLDACAEGIAAFDAFVPDGVLTIAGATAHVALLAGPLARFEGWAFEERLLPPIHAVAGVRGTALAGYCGQATAGRYGQATAGYRGTATAGYRGTATAGEEGYAMAGEWGRATAGDRGQAVAGYWGTATAGDYGIIQIDRYVRRRRTAVGYIGETRDRDGSVLEAGVAYKVDSKGQFYRA